jgi:hypothetical protein
MFRKTAVITVFLSLLVFTAFGAAIKHFGSGFGAGPFGAGTGVIVTTLSKSAYQNPSTVYFGAVTRSFTSSAESLLQQTVNSGSTSTAMVGASSDTAQMIYFSSSALDGTLGLYPNISGTGSVVSGGSVAVTAGAPYQWDYILSGTTNSLALTSTNSLVFTAGTTAGGLTTTATNTSVIGVGLYP